jgi:predicted nucleotide-binding protein
VFYHVRITPKGRQRGREDALALDKDADWIEEHITAPRRQGHDIFVDGRGFSWADVEQIHITETDQTVDQLIPQMDARLTESGLITATPTKWYVVTDGRDVTEQFITGPPGTGPSAAADKATTFATDRKAVMVIYGHDTQANEALFAWLRAIGLQPREWTQLIQASGSASPYVGEVLDKALQNVQAVIAFFTPDEYVTSAGPQDDSTWRLQARPNVLIEAGMALITHPTRTVIVTLGTQELPSDLAGRHYVRLSRTAVEPLHDFAGRLRAAGCDTDTTGTAWLDPGRFPDRRAAMPLADGGQPAASSQQANEARGYPREEVHEEAQARKEAQRAKEDTDARQVTAVIEAKPGVNSTHLITVSTPITYPIKLLEGQITWQTNNGLGMTGFGFAGDPPRTDDRHRRYTFRASISPQIHDPEPIIRFVNLHGNRYYHYRDHTQRFPHHTDWTEAANTIDQWLRTGPKPDQTPRP